MSENFNAALGGRGQGPSPWDSLTKFGRVDIGGEVSDTEKLGGTREVGSAGEPGAEYADNDNAKHINGNTEHDNSDTEHIHGNTEHIEEVNAGDGANPILEDVTEKGAGWSPKPGQILRESIEYLGYVPKNQGAGYYGANPSPEATIAEESPDDHMFSGEKFERLRDREFELHGAVLKASEKVGSQTREALGRLKTTIANNLSESGKIEAGYCFNNLIQFAVDSYGDDSHNPSNTGSRNSYILQNAPWVINAEDSEKLSTTNILLAVIDKHFPSQFQNDFPTATDSEYTKEADENDKRFMGILRECEEAFFSGRRSSANLGLRPKSLDELDAKERDVANVTCSFLAHPSRKGVDTLEAFYAKQAENQSSAIANLSKHFEVASANKEIADNLAKLARGLESTKKEFFTSVINYICFKMEPTASPKVTGAATNSSPNETAPESGEPHDKSTQPGEEVDSIKKAFV